MHIYIPCVLIGQRVSQEQMLEGGVEKSRAVVWRRGAALVRLPVTWQDGRLAVTESRDVIAQERHLVVPTLEGKEPAEFPVFAAVVPRQVPQLLRRQDHAAVTLLFITTVWLLAWQFLKRLKSGHTSHVAQVCDCKRVFFEGLITTSISSHERPKRNIILPILLNPCLQQVSQGLHQVSEGGTI